ncbi:MAG: glycosyltransferase family 39 protein [Bacteroidia bacterium]|nr:glycosyltransferase family 39 protein [Bacteroidia bacterium]
MLQWEIGGYNYDYVFNNNAAFLSFNARDYGVAFELPLLIIEKLFRIEDTRYVFLGRHLLTHLFFLIGALYCYKLIVHLYNNKWLGIIGFLLLMFSPRIYADSMVNTKDIPFMSMFFIAFYQIARAFENKSTRNFLLLGVIIGLMINLRILGLLLLACVLFFLVLDGLIEKQYKKNAGLLSVLILSALITLFITWPYLWINPLGNITAAFTHMSKFNWNGTNLYNGKQALAQQLPWDYIPTWFVVSTPIYYQLLALAAVVMLLIGFGKTPMLYLKNTKQRNQLYFLICFFVPVMAVIVLKSVLYDGWRHLYFIYAPFVMLCVYTINALWQTKFKKPVVGVTLVSMAWVGIFMVKSFPHQNVYFNELTDTRTPEYLRTRYDLDYWGVSYRKSLEYILENDTAAHIKISADSDPGAFNQHLLPLNQRKRLTYLPDTAGATYFVTNFRWHYNDYDGMENKKVFAVKVGNNTINAVYKLR